MYREVPMVESERSFGSLALFFAVATPTLQNRRNSAPNCFAQLVCHAVAQPSVVDVHDQFVNVFGVAKAHEWIRCNWDATKIAFDVQL